MKIFVFYFVVLHDIVKKLGETYSVTSTIFGMAATISLNITFVLNILFNFQKGNTFIICFILLFILKLYYFYKDKRYLSFIKQNSNIQLYKYLFVITYMIISVIMLGITAT